MNDTVARSTIRILFARAAFLVFATLFGATLSVVVFGILTAALYLMGYLTRDAAVEKTLMAAICFGLMGLGFGCRELARITRTDNNVSHPIAANRDEG